MKSMQKAWCAAALLLTGIQGWAAETVTAASPAKSVTPDAVYDRTKDPHPFTVFMKEGGWCWFQSPRAVICDGKIFMGSVQGTGSGPALVGVYDLHAQKPLGAAVMKDPCDRDDHNAPAFYVRPDGRVLAVYSRHNKERFFYTRLSEPGDPLKWSEPATNKTGAKVTYANLLELKDEGKLYNFYRGIDWNPTFVTSTDGGITWSREDHFIANEAEGTQRPYAAYCGNGKDTIFISFTDAHPRDFGNSIYYAEFRGGKFWRANGTLIKDLAKDGPLRPSEAELIFKGGGEPGRGRSLSASRSGWVSSMAVDTSGRPRIAYSLYISNTDHRYRLASWDGTRWIDREVAFAGTCLYDRESSYTGLISLDPADPDYVVISTDVDPQTGKAAGTHEIYRARIGLADTVQNIRWEPLTQNSPVRNIRPVILRDGNRRIILWTRGVFETFSNYQMDTVGLTEPAGPSAGGSVNPFAADTLREIMLRTMRYQEGAGILPRTNTPVCNWVTGTFYAGVMQCYNVTGDPEFLNAARSWSEAAGWSCGEKRPLNADDVASAQTFLDVYFADKKPEQIEQIRRIFESEYFGQDMIAYKKVGNNSPWKGEGTVPFIGRHIWWWADSLFMAPPLMARLGAATGDPRYYELLHKLYWDTVAFLYNGEERLIFRDQTLFGAKTPGGKPAFWGRGNGWVIGGLVRTIDYLPETDPMRPKYIRLFQDMMARIVTLQGEDGLWRSSLNEPEWFPMKETSGSSFFCFGLAAGINRGWLDRETYYPHMVCAWEGLVGCLSPEGQLQWSQGVGDRPRKTDSGNSNIYTQGSFLMAAAEIYRMETTRNRDAANGANLGKLK